MEVNVHKNIYLKLILYIKIYRFIDINVISSGIMMRR